MLRCYEPAHIAGVSKTTYAPATPRCLDWRRDLQRTSTNEDPPDSIRRPRVAALLVVIAAIAAALGHQSPASSSSTAIARDAAPHVASQRAPRRARRGRRCRPDGTTVFDDQVPGVANSIPRSSVPCARRRPTPRTTGSGSSSTAAGVPRSTRSSCSVRRSRSTAHEAEAARWVATPNRSAHVSGTRSTSGPPRPRRGCPRTAPRTGCARSTATSPGTTSCARKPSITAARPCTPTRRTIQGCSSDERPLGRPRPGRPDRRGLVRTTPPEHRHRHRQPQERLRAGTRR